MVSESNWHHAGSSNSRLSFESDRGDRYLCLDGKRAYHVGFGCQTCSFLFERLSGANQAVQIESTAEALRNGVNSLNDEVVRLIEAGLPEDNYCAILGEFPVTMVKPGEPDDYFVKEQIALWGEDPFWCLPHDPRVPYFRAGDRDMGESKQLFNFIVPMFPTQWLNMTTVAEYKEALATKSSGTAIALGVLDVRSPVDWKQEKAPGPTEHWCLTHYLLDGHHKLNAASEAGKPLRLLSFIGSSFGLSEQSGIQRVVDLMKTTS